MPALDIICLANSRKLRGRCVAGLRADGGGWIRPVAPSEDGSLFGQHYILDHGFEPQILDLIRIDVTKAQPQAHQPENWLIGNAQWKLLARPASQQQITLIAQSVESGPSLFGDCSDKMDFKNLSDDPTSSSLCLIRPEKIWWQITTSYTGRRQTRAIFNLSGRLYNLVITDPVWENRLSFLGYGVHTCEAANLQENSNILFTVSLGEPLPSDNQCYKLVAGVVLLPRK
jgi:hypothetical protein